MAAATAWPRKSRDMHNHHIDSTVWDGFRFRPDDVVIATYAKSGTTWTQQIVGQLVFGGSAEVDVGELSPWVDLRVPPKEVKLAALEAQTHRRFVKTHLPVDALVFSPEAKYLFIGRDGRDVVWSLYNHHLHANATWYQLLNDTPGRAGPPIEPPGADVRAYFLDWLERDGHPFWPFWESIASWWAIRHLPNVLPVHFADLKRDLPGEIGRIAAFLGCAIAPEQRDAIVEHCSFPYMKAHAERVAPLGGSVWEGGAATFIHQGINGRWRDVLTAEDSARYEAMARLRLGADCARWLAEGGAAD
ncbi:MAG: sulfotransferase domain-containing protein [Geminicoccaceae bacterium]